MTQLNCVENNQSFKVFLGIVAKNDDYLSNKVRKVVQQFLDAFMQNHQLFLSVDVAMLIEAKLLEESSECTEFWRNKLSVDSSYLLKAITGYSNVNGEEALDPSALVLPNLKLIKTSLFAEKCYRLFFEKSGFKWRDIHKGEEKETGSLEAMANGFIYGLHFMQAPINLKLLSSIHWRCTTHVEGLRDEVKPGTVRDEDVVFGLATTDLENVYEIMTSKLYGSAYVIAGSRLEILKRGDALNALVNDEMAQYNEDMKNISEPLAKLSRIVDFIQMLVRVQPFHDGNNRTIGKVLFNLELLKHHLLPTQLEINNFATAKKNDLTKMIFQGMQAFQAEPSEEEQSLYCTKTIASMVTVLNSAPFRRDGTGSQFQSLTLFSSPDKERHIDGAASPSIFYGGGSSKKTDMRRPRMEQKDNEAESRSGSPQPKPPPPPLPIALF